MAKIVPQQWQRLSALLDTALEMTDGDRRAWLERLTESNEPVVEQLRTLLAQHARFETEQFVCPPPNISDALLAEQRRVEQAAWELRAGALVGPYRLVEEIGHGGMSVVWSADRADGAYSRRVALKLPHATWAMAMLKERMARERDVLAALEHPGIGRLYDAGFTEDGRPYLALELISGRPIDVYCRERNAGVRPDLELVLQVARAVAFAHSRLIVHRDLKPSNVLVDDAGRVHLLDFGIAKLLGSEESGEGAATQLGARALTPHYASPEQLRGDPISTATDIYSLGAVAYELVSGERVHEGAASARANAPSDRRRSPVAPGKRCSDAARARVIRGELDTIILRALKENVNERYSTMAAFADDLERFLAHKPVLAQADSLGYRIQKFVRRNRLAVGASVAIALALVVGAGISLWQAKLARQQAFRAEQVKEFMLSIFTEADTDSGASKDTTAAELLEQAHKRLAAKPVGDVETRIELLTAIGHAMVGHQDEKGAVNVLEEAASLAEKHLPKAHRQIAAVQVALAEALFESGDNVRALQVIERAEQGMRANGSAEGLVEALRWKSSIVIGAGQVEEGVRLAREAVQIADTRLSDRQIKEKVEAYGSLTNAMESAKLKGRAAVAQRTYELARRLYGDRVTAELLVYRVQYATALAGEGDAARGLAELQEAAKQQVAFLGRDRSDVAYTYFQMGITAMNLGRPQVAIDSLREAVSINEAVSAGEPSINGSQSHMALGLALLLARQFEAAEREFVSAEQTLLKFVDGSNPLVRNARSARALALTRLGKLDAADAILSDIAQLPFANEGSAATVEYRLGALRHAQGRLAEAHKLLRAAADSYTAQSQTRSAALVMLELGAVLLAEADAKDALDVLQRAWTSYFETLPAESPDRADVQALMARARRAADPRIAD